MFDKMISMIKIGEKEVESDYYLAKLLEGDIINFIYRLGDLSNLEHKLSFRPISKYYYRKTTWTYGGGESEEGNEECIEEKGTLVSSITSSKGEGKIKRAVCEDYRIGLDLYLLEDKRFLLAKYHSVFLDYDEYGRDHEVQESEGKMVDNVCIDTNKSMIDIVKEIKDFLERNKII